MRVKAITAVVLWFLSSYVAFGAFVSFSIKSVRVLNIFGLFNLFHSGFYYPHTIDAIVRTKPNQTILYLSLIF